MPDARDTLCPACRGMGAISNASCRCIFRMTCRKSCFTTRRPRGLTVAGPKHTVYTTTSSVGERGRAAPGAGGVAVTPQA